MCDLPKEAVKMLMLRVGNTKTELCVSYRQPQSDSEEYRLIL